MIFIDMTADPPAIIEYIRAAELEAYVAGCRPNFNEFPEIEEDVSGGVLSPNRADALEGLTSYLHEDWDCDGARALSVEILQSAEQMLSQLPSLVPNPEVAPAANGSLCMEWSNGRNLVWADVEPDGKLLTLTKFAGEKTEQAFVSSDESGRHYLATALVRLYS